MPDNSTRCQFSFADGRRCRMIRSPKHDSFCFRHAPKEITPLPADRIAEELASLSGEFNTASDINHILGKLFSLMAAGRIPRRDAVSLAYVAQLLLQSLPAVRQEMKQTLGQQGWEAAVEAALCDDEPSQAPPAQEQPNEHIRASRPEAPFK